MASDITPTSMTRQSETERHPFCALSRDGVVYASISPAALPCNPLSKLLSSPDDCDPLPDGAYLNESSTNLHPNPCSVFIIARWKCYSVRTYWRSVARYTPHQYPPVSPWSLSLWLGLPCRATTHLHIILDTVLSLG